MQTNISFRCVACWKVLLLPALLAFSLISPCPIVAQDNSQGIAQENSQGNDFRSSQSSTSGSVTQYPESQGEYALPNAPSASRRSPNAISFDERVRVYRHSILSPYSYIGAPFGAAIGQWEDEPPEWGQGAKGYFHRFGSGVGRHLIAQTIRFGVAAADGEDPRYHPAEGGSVWNRGLHAVAETFTSRTAGGTRIPAFSRFAGVYGAAAVSNLWYPESRTTTGYVLRRGSTALASSIAIHLIEEFFPLGRRSQALRETSSQPNQDTDKTTGGTDERGRQ